MKKLTILLLLSLILIIGCKSKPDNSNNQKVVSSKDNIKKNEEIISDSKQKQDNDSIVELKLFLESEKRFKIAGNFKNDPNTKKAIFNYTQGSDSNEARITLYHIGDRIVRIEKRIYDLGNTQLSYSMFDFNVDNSCYSNTQRNKKDKMSYINAMYWDTINRFDTDYKPIKIDVTQKQQIIESTKAELDSIMQHFPEFKYSFNWK